MRKADGSLPTARELADHIASIGIEEFMAIVVLTITRLCYRNTANERTYAALTELMHAVERIGEAVYQDGRAQKH